MPKLRFLHFAVIKDAGDAAILEILNNQTKFVAVIGADNCLHIDIFPATNTVHSLIARGLLNDLDVSDDHFIGAGKVTDREPRWGSLSCCSNPDSPSRGFGYDRPENEADAKKMLQIIHDALREKYEELISSKSA